MKLNLDLGVSEKERYGDVPPQTSSSDKIVYPAFNYSGPDELDLPEDGTMTIRFCKTSETSSVRDGKHHYECTIEVQKIDSVEGMKEAPYKRDTGTEDALDKLAEALSERESEEDDE